jgi:hypothetical protein
MDRMNRIQSAEGERLKGRAAKEKNSAYLSQLTSRLLTSFRPVFFSLHPVDPVHPCLLTGVRIKFADEVNYPFI